MAEIPVESASAPVINVMEEDTLLLQETRISLFIKLAFLVFTYSGTTKLLQ